MRITSMNRVDIGLFDYDRHNAVYYFAMNADEQIYLRYGGRDASSPEAYLNLDSFELALEAGLRQHDLYQKNRLPRQTRPRPLYPADVPLLDEEVLSLGRCVECHLIADYQLLEHEFDGTLNKLRDMFVYPDIKTIGIHLDVPKGLVVGKATGAVAAAGMQPGDLIVAINEVPVLTFGDLQHQYNKVPRDAARVELAVQRAGHVEKLSVDLPREWWYTDLYHRYWTVDPEAFFSMRPLSADRKRELSLAPNGLAAEVTKVETGAQVYNLHQLHAGDIIYSVNGVEADDFTQNLEIYIKLNVQAGEAFMVKLLRDGQKMDMRIRTYREHFRKQKI